MLSQPYIDALLVDEEAADQVWEAWDKGEIDNGTAHLAWGIIANNPFRHVAPLSLHSGSAGMFPI